MCVCLHADRSATVVALLERVNAALLARQLPSAICLYTDDGFELQGDCIVGDLLVDRDVLFVTKSGIQYSRGLGNFIHVDLLVRTRFFKCSTCW